MPRPDAETIIAKYKEAQTARSYHENDWRLASAYCLPRHYSAWQTSGPASFQGSKAAAARRVAYDTTGVRSLPKYVSVLSRMATPMSQRWHTVSADNRDLMRVHAVQAYFDDVTDVLFKMRYETRAKFEQSSTEVYAGMGVYGTGPMYLGQRRRSPLDTRGGFLYKACPLRDVFLLIDDDGNVSMVFRRFWLNVRQFKEKFPDDEMPPRVAAEASKAKSSEMTFFEFIHVVYVKGVDDHDPEAFDNRRFPVGGSYVAVDDRAYIGEEHGFRSMPYLTPRTFTEAGDPYGFSPAMQAIPALGSASAVKKSYLKQGQRATDQVLLAHDDAVLNGRIDLNPGRINYGAVDAQGRKLVHALETGNFQVAENILADERRDIEDSFFVTLFQILTETPQMSATEVMERVAEKASLLAPTMGRLQSELLGPMIEREIEIASEMGRLPEMPPELQEAEGEYQIIYTSPLAKGQYAEETSGFLRSLEIAANAAAATQDPSHLDHFNLDAALPEIADHLATPARWLNTDAQKQAIRDARQQQRQAQELISAAPAVASVAKTASDIQGGQP